MAHFQSSDGTVIAYEKSGSGPALIIVDGACCYREMGPSRGLAKALAQHFTVFIYDRRGRGESSDRAPYSVEREVEDLAAVIKEAGGSAFVYGVSSGAALALEAANRGVSIRKLALFEAPFIVDDTRNPIPNDFLEKLNNAIASNRRADAVRMFMRLVGVPSIFVALMRFMPAWSKLKAVAHTLPYDITLVKDFERGQPLPAGRWNSVTMPTLVIDGGKSPVWMRNAMRSLAGVLPNARYETLPGQTHMVKAKAQVPPLVQFFNGQNANAERIAMTENSPAL